MVLAYALRMPAANPAIIEHVVGFVLLWQLMQHEQIMSVIFHHKSKWSDVRDGSDSSVRRRPS
jgi:hypothetical protein